MNKDRCSICNVAKVSVSFNLVPKPPYGDWYTFEEFFELCKDRSITNMDGSGFFATETHYSRIPAVPRIFETEGAPKFTGVFTHVAWFNK